MQKFKALAVTLLAVAGLPILAQAAPAVSTASVNMRSGPSTNYPPVLVIPAGSRVEIAGCMQSANWCDVAYRGYRGWVSGSYLQAAVSRRQVYVDPQYYRPLGIPNVTFSVNTYWDRHYRSRDFYRDRDRWSQGDRQPPPRRDDRGDWRGRDQGRDDRRGDNGWRGDDARRGDVGRPEYQQPRDVGRAPGGRDYAPNPSDVPSGQPMMNCQPGEVSSSGSCN